MKYVIVLPYAYGPYAIDCFETFDVKLTENCVAVDNTGAGGHENFGVAGSWNIGIDRLREIDGFYIWRKCVANIGSSDLGGMGRRKRCLFHFNNIMETSLSIRAQAGR